MVVSIQYIQMEIVTIIKLASGLVYDQEDKNMMERIISI
jgi:hypothetical protein